jgi:hypothetical protein
MKRILLLCAALALPIAAGAQTVQLQVGTQPALEVQRLAPQLVAFAGGDLNFANLVNGLALGVPVTLTSLVAPGVTQTVTFTPTGTMTPLQIAQTLEAARQSLIARGVSAPNAQQLAATLIGGTLQTPAGNTVVSALVPATIPTTAAAASAAGSTASAPSPAAAIQQQNSAAAGASAAGTAVHNTSDSPLPRGVADTPPTPTPGATTTTQPPAAFARPATPAPFGAPPMGATR